MKTAEQKRKDTLNTQKKKSKNCKGRRGWQKERDKAPSYFFCKHSNQKRRASKRGSPKERASGYGRIPYHSIPECHRRQTIMQLRILEFSDSRPLCTYGYGKGLRFQTIMHLPRLECSDSRPIMQLWLWKGLDSTPLCILQELSTKTILLHNFKFRHRTLHCVKLNPEASPPFWLIT